jgi:hypothetical protein
MGTPGVAGKHHDLVNFTKKYKAGLHSFFLDMNSWKKFKTKFKLDWKKTRFDPSGRVAVPQERGIYAFTLELTQTKLPPHGYILYVGITGDNSNATLRGRYGQYLLNLQNEDGRPAVFYMMRNFKDHLFFNFAALPNSTADLAKIEKAFINAVMPPVNKRDFEARIGAAKAAAF